MTMLSIEPQPRDERWGRIAAHAPVLAATCQDYVAQISVTARPSTARALDACLGIFSEWLIDHDANVIAFRQINRRHIEVLRTALARTLNRAVGKLDLFGDSPRQREDGFHALVGEVRCRIEHQRAVRAIQLSDGDRL